MSRRRKEAGVKMLLDVSGRIDAALHAFVDRQPVSQFYDLVRYHLGWPADPAPFRPAAVLCVLACEACQGTFERALPMAVAMALLQGFEQNQEDLERQRRTREGRQSVWSLWGAPQAMNAGDGMHALAKMALLEGRERLPAAEVLQLEQALDECCLRCCEAIWEEHRAAGCATAGQGATEGSGAAGQGAGEGSGAAGHGVAGDSGLVTRGAALFGCAAYAGCFLAGVGDSQQAGCLRRFGELLGAAVDAAGCPDADALRRQALAALEGSGAAASQCEALRSLAYYILASEA
jgi:hypothetical protein